MLIYSRVKFERNHNFFQTGFVPSVQFPLFSKGIKIFMKNTEITEITENKKIAENIYDMRILTQNMARSARAGQFVHIACGGDTFLRRPISVCDTDGDILRVVYEIKGKGTTRLSQKRKGDKLDVLGPLGNWFNITKEKSLIIGGGVGIYPLLFLAKKLDRPAVLLGFRTESLVTFTDEFASVSSRVSVCTNDGSYGQTGLVTDFMDEITARENIEKIYACGPKPMLRAVCEKADGYKNIKTYVSMEEHMGCGIGACLVCSCDVRKNGGIKRVQVCRNGPVFLASEVVW